MHARLLIGLIGIVVLAQTATAGASQNKAREPFTGTWNVFYPDGKKVVFHLNQDGTASKQPRSVAGTWDASRKVAWITWEDGWRDKLQLGKTAVVWALAPGLHPNQPPTATGTAVRVQGMVETETKK